MNATVPSITRDEVLRRQATLAAAIEAGKTDTDRAREEYREHRLAELIADAEAIDASLALGFAGMDVASAEMLEAYRTHDDAELGRLVRRAVHDRLARAVDLRVEEDTFAKFPEEAL